MAKHAGKFLAVAALTGFSLLSTGCEQEQDRVMASAQACMDRATTAAAANECAAKVAGIDTPAAYLIRCSANFIAQGFTGQRIADAYQGMTSNTNSGSDPMMSMISYLVFTNSDSMNSVESTLANCTKSGTVGMLRLAEVANLATTIATVGLPTGKDLADFDPANSDPAALEQLAKDTVANLIDNPTPAKQEAIGNVALQMNQSVCGAGSSLADKEVCTYMAEAMLGTTNAQTIGTRLLDILKREANIP